MLSTVSSSQVKSAIQFDTKHASLLLELGVLAPIVLVYLFLALYRIDHQSLWGDELASIQSAASDQPFFRSTLWGTGHGPLYFAFLHLWLKAGQTEFAIRSLSAFLGMAAVCLMYATGLRLFNRRVAVVSAALLATSPFFIWYSQEARYITLAISTSLVCMYSFHHALSTGTFRSWLIYALATTAALLSFITNAFAVAAQGLYLLSSKQHRGPNLRKWLAWQVLVSLVFGTWLLISYGRLSMVASPKTGVANIELDPIALETGTPRELSAAVIPYTLFVFSSGFSMGPSVRELHISRDFSTLLDHLPVLAPLMLLFATLFVVGIVKLSRKHGDTAVLLLFWLVVPIVCVVIAAATTDVAYNVRYAAVALPAYILILATAITTFRKRTVQLIMLTAVIFVNGLSLANHYFNPRYAREDARAAARYLESAGHSRDVIVVVGNPTAFQHYYQGNLAIVSWGRPVNSHRATVNKNVQDLAQHYSRLWLVTIRPWETDPEGNVKASLDQALKNLQEMAFPGVEISSYSGKLPS